MRMRVSDGGRGEGVREFNGDGEAALFQEILPRQQGWLQLWRG